MIRARLERDSRSFCLEVQGHAGLAPRGEDMLCAVVSALVWGLECYVNRLERQGLTLCSTDVELEPGGARICLYPEPQARGQAAGAFGLAAEILALLGKNFPGNIQFTLKRRKT